MSLIYWSPCLGELKNQGLLNCQSSNSNSFTANNNGKIGKCIYVTNQIDTGVTANDWDINQNSITMMGWFKFPRTAIETIVNSKTYDNIHADSVCTLLGNNSYGGLSLHIGTNNIYKSGSFTNLYAYGTIRGGSALIINKSYDVPFDTWVHIAVVFDIVNKKMTLYINGEMFNEKDITSSLNNNPTMRYFGMCLMQRYGGNGFSPSMPFYCNDIRLYTNALSPEEIHTLSLGLVAHYPLTLATADELLGDVIEDNETFLVRKAIANKRGMFDEIVGGSVVWNQLARLINSAITRNGVTVTPNDDGSVTVNGTSNAFGALSAFKSFNSINGHKYLITMKGLVSGLSVYTSIGSNGLLNNPAVRMATADGVVDATLRTDNGVTYNNVKVWINTHDLTQMFGTTIADYIYSLETTTAGSGITWLHSHGFFTEEYYPYDAGSLKSVEGILKKNVFGTDSSLLDLDGYMSTLGIAKTDGYYTTTASQWLAKSKDIPLPINYIPNQQYTVKVSGKCHDNLTSFSVIIYYTDGTYSYSAQINSKTDAIDYGNSSVNKTVSKIVFTYGSGGGYNFYMKDFCVYPYPANFADNAFPPYSPHSYFYNSPTLRGILKLDTNNKLYYDGDIWEANGNVTRKYGIVDLGTLTWSKSSTRTNCFTADFPQAKRWYNLNTHGDEIENIICNKYATINGTDGYNGTDKSVSGAYWNAINKLNIADSTLWNGVDAAGFKTAMSGVCLVYELATPTTEASTKFTNPQIYEPDGIEMWDTTGVIPPSHQTKYVDSLAEGGSYTYDEYISHLGVGDNIVYDVSGHQYNGELYCTSDQILTDANLTPSNWTHLAPTCTKYTGDKKHHHFEMVEASSSYWEHVYMPVTVTNGFSYKLSMMYQVFDDITPVNSSRPFTFQVLSAVPTNADSFNNVLASIPIGNSAMSAPKYGECTFTASGTTVWLNIPGGYFKDGTVSANHCVDFLNMKLSMVTSTGSFLEELNTPKYNNAINPRSAENGDSTSNSKWGTAYIRGDCGLTTPNELTISFWCYARNDGYRAGTGQGAFCTSIYESGDSIGTDYLTSAMNHRDTGVDINDASGSHHLRLPISFIANEWHHYTFTYDGQNAKGYRDGILVSTQSYSEKYALGTFKSVVLGLSQAGGVWRRNNNTYSDLRVYATALSADDVLALYNNHRQYMGVYTFDGNTTGIRTDWSTANIGTGDFTISAWAKLTTSSKTYQPIVSNKSTGAASVGCAIYFNHSQNKFLWSTGSGSSAKEIWTAQTFPDIYDTWTHVVMVRNSSDPKIGYFYINGVRKELASVATALDISTTTPLYIGGLYADAANYRWTGNISDVRFYNKALSEQQILRLYNNSSP